MLASGSKIIKVRPTTSTMKEPGELVVTTSNSDIAKFGTHLERQTPLKVITDCHGHRTNEKLLEEKILSGV